MKRIFVIACCAILLISCHENLEDRAAREAKEEPVYSGRFSLADEDGKKNGEHRFPSIDDPWGWKNDERGK